MLEANNDVEIMLRSFNLPQREYLTENIGGFDVNVQRIAPPDFNENSTKRYPVLVYVYGKSRQINAPPLPDCITATSRKTPSVPIPDRIFAWDGGSRTTL